MTARPGRQRMMARPRRELEGRHRSAPIGALIGAGVVLVGLFVVSGFGAGGGHGSLGGSSSASPGPSAAIAATSTSSPPRPTADPRWTPSPSRLTLLPQAETPGATSTPPPTDVPAPTATPTPTAAATPTASAGATPTPTPAARPSPTGPPPKGAAPTGPDGFDQLRTTVRIGFPLPGTASYRFRNNYLERRFGAPEPYNHWFSRIRGVLRRAHDGNDIYARLGTPILAPFSGTVIDPATRWKPWRADRYGNCVVIVSDEPTSPGYATFLAHLATVRVRLGQHVERGQKVGTLGDTGNAKGVAPHLHFELRTPFLFAVTELGRKRTIDAFDPFRSLRASDPHRASVSR